MLILWKRFGQAATMSAGCFAEVFPKLLDNLPQNDLNASILSVIVEFVVNLQ